MDSPAALDDIVPQNSFVWLDLESDEVESVLDDGLYVEEQ